jgi:tetratricopeptide (TPR) repeat protein
VPELALGLVHLAGQARVHPKGLLMHRDRILARVALTLAGLAFAGALGVAIFSTRSPRLTSAPPATTASGAVPLSGSATCRDCHARFYQLWSTSWHGLAMQPFTPSFASTKLTPQDKPRMIGGKSYLVETGAQGGQVRERGPQGDTSFPILHALGGKNVYYFLAPVGRGRLQTLPLAYDVHKKEWFDTAASGMRHFTDLAEPPLDWRDPLYTFNTSCYNCHVTQLATNYDVATDGYQTTWAEPGISCEACHGPSRDHVTAARLLAAGAPMADLKLIRTKTFTADQHNASCSSCHAKAAPITRAYLPGEPFFDHFDLSTLESPDFYPDGRDLGENYTLTGWQMNPCAKSGQMHCVQCHTSSGRFRFAQEPNQACLPCHAERVANAPAHTHHQAGSAGNQCIACHLPKTEFARMVRSDHSLRPPAPAATMAFGSPNACNLCHQDQEAAWANRKVRQWYVDDYQAPLLERARLVAAARRHDWSHLGDMLRSVTAPGRDEVFATSLIRLLAACPDPRKTPALVQALKDPSPLVRGAAAAGLAPATREVQQALLAATRDPSRLVRVRAVASLAGLQRQGLSPTDREGVEQADAELRTSLTARPDDWASQYNLGNYHMSRGQLEAAAKAFDLAHRLRADVVTPLVNGAMAHARLGDNAAALRSLLEAQRLEPTNPAVNYNLGLLQVDLGQAGLAEQSLRAALKADPRLAGAAYALGILVSQRHTSEAVDLFREAARLEPGEARYSYALAYAWLQHGNSGAAAQCLTTLIASQPAYLDAYKLLGAIHERASDIAAARRVYAAALLRPELSVNERPFFESRLRALASAPPRNAGP